MPVAITIFLTSIINLKRLRKKIQWTTGTIILKRRRKNLPDNPPQIRQCKPVILVLKHFIVLY